jgi:hypothetical protein
MITHPALDDLCSLWTVKCGGRMMPARRDIDVLELGHWLGHVALVDVLDGAEFRYRLFGDWLVERYGARAHPRRPEELGGETGRVARSDLEKACAYKAPVFVLRPGAPALGCAQYAELVLPFSEDGETVDALLVAAYPLPKLH